MNSNNPFSLYFKGVSVFSVSPCKSACQSSAWVPPLLQTARLRRICSAFLLALGNFHLLTLLRFSSSWFFFQYYDFG